MWQKQILKLPKSAENALREGANAPFSFSVSGSRLGVHNWTHGIQTASGSYLSPENAIKAFSVKFSDYADPSRPQGVQDVVAVMVTASTAEEFIQHLEAVAQIMPDTTFKQALDYAKSTKDLAKTKMIKTPQIASPSFSAGGDITPSSGRMLQKALQNQPLAREKPDPFAIIEQLKKRKAEREAETQQQVARLLNAKAEVWAFSERGYLESIAHQIADSMPSSANVFTACVCFVGGNLQQLRDLLND